MNFRNALVAATMLALPLAANAQPITGLYIGGWRWREHHARRDFGNCPGRRRPWRQMAARI